MSRRAARIDANQTRIVRALRDIGAVVHSLAGVGSGCPDLLVGFRGVTFLLEVKDGSKPLSERKLTPDQGRWHEEWLLLSGAPLDVVTCEDDALRAIGAIQ